MDSIRRVSAVLLVFLLTALSAEGAPLVNQLRNHSSPYLAAHGADPVAWQEWNAATVARARQEGKLLYLSIGYFSCHWCHVMQRESYRNPEIARFLNEHFIPVKVDRELEPALDQRLIEFVETTRGRSGWPLNVFVTPDGHPLYATLYHPPREFMDVVMRIDDLWRHDRARLTALARTGAVQPKGPGKPAVDRAQAVRLAGKVLADAQARADSMQGGFGEQGKFPQVPQLAFLLSYVERTQDTQVKEFLLLTLDAMAMHGLQDHLDGGFFRYTVDPSWKTPHFEKMLYDNAQLARLYLQAARVLEREEYRLIATRTLDFLLRELRASSGGFVAALSAIDEHGVEGGYYLWSQQELESLLTPAELEVYRPYAGMTGAASFDPGYLPLRATPPSVLAGQLRLNPDDVRSRLASAEEKLRSARRARGLPRDTKELAAWNGLALAAFTDAAQATGDIRYRDAAKAVRNYLADVLWDGKILARSRVEGKATGKAALEDYAYVAAALADWARYTGAERDFALARSIASAGWQRFYSPKGWRLETESLLIDESGQDVVSDGTTPSPSAVLIATSLMLAANDRDPALRQKALSALNSGSSVMADNPFWYATPVGVLLGATQPAP
jgi:uncharacterized protein YyaL (SSP411 family)